MSVDGQATKGAPAEPRLGVHLSLGRSPATSLAEAAAEGARCIQIFASSPGAWKPPALHKLRLAELEAGRCQHDVNPLFIHAIYLINPASPVELLVKRSRDSLIATLTAGAALRASGVVTHLGSHGGRGFDAVAEQVAGVLIDVLESTPADVDLILENSAGTGGIIGSQLEELGTLIRLAGNHRRLKVCLDTAHLFAAGWDLCAAATAPQLLKEIDTHFGLERLALLHSNDSKVPCASRRDRHAMIGEGYIGLDGFRFLLDQCELRRIPWILETPDLGLEKGDDLRFSSLRTLVDLCETRLNVITIGHGRIARSDNRSQRQRGRPARHLDSLEEDA